MNENVFQRKLKIISYKLQHQTSFACICYEYVLRDLSKSSKNRSWQLVRCTPTRPQLEVACSPRHRTQTRRGSRRVRPAV